MVDRLKLRSVLAAKDVSQRTLAQELQIAPNTLSSKMRGKSVFTTDEVLKICSFLEIVDPEELRQIFFSPSVP